MKSSLVLFILIFNVLNFSCKNKPIQERPKMEKADESTKEYSSKYVCPMHCAGSGSDHPGKCPVCEMDYELNPTETKDSIH